MQERMLNERELAESARLVHWVLRRRLIVVRTIYALEVAALVGPAGLVVLATQLPREWAVGLLLAAIVLLVGLAAGSVAMVRWGRRSEEHFNWRRDLLRRQRGAGR